MDMAHMTVALLVVCSSACLALLWLLRDHLLSSLVFIYLTSESLETPSSLAFTQSATHLVFSAVEYHLIFVLYPCMDLRLRIVFYRMPAHSYGMSCAEMRGALPPLVGFRPHTV